MEPMTCACGAVLADKDRLGNALVCPKCGQTNRNSSSAQQSALPPQVEALIQKADSRPERFRVPSRVSLHAGLLAGLGTALAAASWGYESKYGPPGTYGAGCFLGVLPALAGLVGWMLVIGQVRGPSPANRASPRGAVDAYLKAVQDERWSAAMMPLSWIATDGQQVFQPALTKEAAAGSPRILDGRSALEKFWTDAEEGLLYMGFRRFSTRDPVALSDRVARVAADLEIHAGGRNLPSGAEAVQVRVGDSVIVNLCLSFLAYEREGKWYVLHAGPLEPMVVRG